ncbi:TatD DNase family protein [Mariprofundus ferrinatatus]|uniref:TatD DNase family protein n=1 Tax=Mariprofundus ferrinatatus TaxID=1921087 RepID=A0A2K8L4V9_9PROT|nr:TatD family hydrolase [Mariprofundus ferrinatatus]ATX82273.1 TatD DNase family protein [Mariprofundus ferrinatatus]
MTDPIALFDTHCHVDFSHYADDRDAMFERMAAAGVEGCVVVGVDFSHINDLRALSEMRSNVWFSVGVHPNHEVEVEPSIKQLCELAAHSRCVAIGETGMDFFRHHVAPEVQEQRFRTHIRAAKAMRKPVIVHNRDADSESIRILQEENVSECGGIMHCFSADMETANAAIDMGMSISFSGNVTFKRNEELREVAAMVPDDLLLVETDAPYLAPVPFRGKRNEPAYVKYIAECIAGVRGVTLAELAARTTRNARARFGI